MVELIYAARRIGGLSALDALDAVPFAWLLRFRTMLWYIEGLGAEPLYRDKPAKRSAAREMLR